MPKCFVGVTVPEIPFDAFEHFQYGLFQFALLLTLSDRHRQTLGDLTEHGQTHCDMEPVKQVFGFWSEIELQVAYGVTAIGEKDNLLI